MKAKEYILLALLAFFTLLYVAMEYVPDFASKVDNFIGIGEKQESTTISSSDDQDEDIYVEESNNDSSDNGQADREISTNSQSIKLLKSINVSTENIGLDLPISNEQSIHVYDISNHQVLYTIEQTGSKYSYDIQAIHLYDLSTKQDKVLNNLEDCHEIYECIMYNGQPLYVESKPSLKLKYGNQTIYASNNTYEHIEIYQLGSTYVSIENYGYNEYGSRIYKFDGTLNQVDSREGTFDYTNVALNKNYLGLNLFGMYDIYKEVDGKLTLSYVTTSLEDNLKDSAIQDYILYDHYICNVDTGSERKMYVGRLEDGAVINDDSIYINSIENLIDIGSDEVFIFVDPDTSILYKAVLNDAEGYIVYASTGLKVDCDAFYYNGNHEVYAYHDADNGEGSLTKITIAF